MTCQTIGCGAPAVWQVADRRREKKVCRTCRDELIGLFGWMLVGRETL